MKAELEKYTATSLQLYGSALGHDYGCQDYTKAVQLVGVRLADEKWLAGLLEQRERLLEAIELLVQEHGFTGDGWPKEGIEWKGARAAIAAAKGGAA